jgi:hypothetical protein
MKRLELLVRLFEFTVARTEELINMNQLKKYSAAELERLTNDIYRELEMETYKQTPKLKVKNLKHPANAHHPLRLLWDRWNNCASRVGKIADQFLR